MNLEDIDSAIEFYKGRIRYYERLKAENKRTSTKSKGFDTLTHSQIKKHLRHFEVAIKTLEVAKKKVVEDNSIWDF